MRRLLGTEAMQGTSTPHLHMHWCQQMQSEEGWCKIKLLAMQSRQAISKQRKICVMNYRQIKYLEVYLCARKEYAYQERHRYLTHTKKEKE